MTSETERIVESAVRATDECRSVAAGRDDWKYMGYVGSALITAAGNRYTGINVELVCGIGFCAEHTAVADMLKHGESRIRIIAAATADGNILPPCGRCRELIYQTDPANLETQVVVPGGRLRTLRDLLPLNWQDYIAEEPEGEESGSGG